jgi:hypothetical protein
MRPQKLISRFAPRRLVYRPLALGGGIILTGSGTVKRRGPVYFGPGAAKNRQTACQAALGRGSRRMSDRLWRRAAKKPFSSSM